VNDIANRLLATYEDDAADAPIGCEYHECYDVAKAVPTQEHYDMFRRVKDEIAEMGIAFPF
jgi:methylamine--corrinoid protein Co-methyltransferase